MPYIGPMDFGENVLMYLAGLPCRACGIPGIRRKFLMVSVILRLQHMDNKTKEVKATEGKGYLTIKSRRQPKANIGTVEKVLEGIWRL